MAYVNGNKPIVTNGLVYALDFGNTKSYTSGSNTARSMVFDPAGTTAVTGSTAIPTLTNGVLNFTGSQFVRRTGSLSVFDSQGSFTVQIVGKANTPGNLFSINTTSGNLASNVTPSSSVFGFNLSSGDFSRTYRGFTSSSLQHVTYRYSQGSIDIFLNGIPVTASQANTALTATAISNALFINSGSNFFSGSVAQFYVYNRALSADEIYENYLVSAGRNSLPVIPKPYSQDENVYKFLQTTGITDSNTVSAISTFVSGLKSAGLWNKMTAIYPFLSTSTGSQTVNLKDPGVLGLGLTGSFSASAVGLTPASSTAYVDALPSNIPYPSINSASAHLSLVSYDVPQGNGFLAGNSARASGGELIISGSKAFHIFKNVGSTFFTVHDPLLNNVEVLVIAGGGSGGSRDAAGGGAGGLVYSSSFSITPGNAVQVTVGNGGYAVPLVGSNQTPGIDGENSIFSTITAIGGGGGGVGTGRNGGSGGGGSFSGIGGLGTAGQGNNGGGGGGFSDTGGGGGGAGSVGETSTGSQIGGAGGSGSYFAQYAGINLGSPSGWFAGGGGGGGTSRSGPGGIGGGGTAGNYSQGQSGSVNTGGGGGAQRQAGYLSGAGGSGLVVVSYDYLPNTTALTGSGTGFYLTDSALTASVNSQFTSGITGSGNIGFLTVSRTGSNSFSIHKNNISQSVSSASLGALSTDIFFNSVNLIGSSSLPLPNTLAYASIGAGLTTTEVATYYNLVSQLQNNLKRQNTLLDNFTGAAAAYSLRRIGPSGYFGPAIRVRRDSDNTLRDIGFTSDGQLDTVGLLDFVGVTGSGFVQTWYDQSGNGRDATQGTNANQPLVISSGSVLNINSKPSLLTDGINDSFTISSINTTSTNYTLFNIGKRRTSSVKYGGMGGGTTPGQAHYLWNDNKYYWQKSNGYLTSNTTYATANQEIMSGVDLQNTANNTQYVNGNVIASTFNSFSFIRTFDRLFQFEGSNFSDGNTQEIILWLSDQTLNLNNINSNINTNYKIYGSATASFDPDYQSFITATGITQPTQSAALETLVSDLKSYGLWNKMKAIYPMITDKNNRLSDSQTLTNNWFQISSSLTVSSSAAPDGSNTGFLFRETADTSEHYITRTVVDDVISGSEYVVSFHGRYLNRPWMAVKTDAGVQGWFNVQTGTTGSFTGSRATVTTLPGGWYRCALYFTASQATAPRAAQFHLADADNSLSYTGNTASGSYIWGVQWENGNLLGPYRVTSNGFTTGSMLDQMKFNLKNTGSFSGSYFNNWNPGYSGNKPDGISAYMDTGLIPSTSLTFNNVSLSFYSRSNTSGSTGKSELCCNNQPGDLPLLQLAIRRLEAGLSDKFTSHIYSWQTSQGAITVDNTNSTGFYISSRTSPTLHKIFKNNINAGSSTSSYSSQPTVPLFLSAQNNNNSTVGNYSDRESAFATIGDGLTDYEAKALYWIVQKYQTTLGRQVY
jgi:hypothetical protein